MLEVPTLLAGHFLPPLHLLLALSARQPNARGHREAAQTRLSDFSEPQQGSDAVERIVRPSR